jgi:hypothetical protein
MKSNKYLLKKDKTYYYSDFNMMCYDLATETRKLVLESNTHLLLCYLSKMLAIKFQYYF